MKTAKLFYSVTVALVFLPGMAGAMQLEKKSDDWYLAEKKLLVDGKEKPFYFSLERITSQIDALLVRYVFSGQATIAQELLSDLWGSVKYGCMSSEEGKRTVKKLKLQDKDEPYLDYLYKNQHILQIQEPVARLLTGLKHWEECQVWLAYVTEKKPTKAVASVVVNYLVWRENEHLVTDQQAEREHLEMCTNMRMAMAVMTHEKVPFQLHMGIFANPIVIRDKKTRPKNLSIELHAFAARALDGLQKIYMITTPLPIMLTIFKKKLGDDCMVGYNDIQKSPVMVDLRQNPEDEKTAEYFPTGFALANLERDNVIFVDQYDEKKENYEHSWFFDNIYPSQDTPYVAVRSNRLAKLF